MMIDTGGNSTAFPSMNQNSGETAVKRVKEAPVSKQTAGAPGGNPGVDVNGPVESLEKTGGSQAQRQQEHPNRPDAEYLEKVAEAVNENMQRFSRALRFTVDESSDEVVVKVIDRQTDEVIRQIPPEEVLDLMEKMEEIQGVIFRDEV